MAEEAAEEDAGTPRRDPSEKQEPHTVMWGKINSWANQTAGASHQQSNSEFCSFVIGSIDKYSRKIDKIRAADQC